MPTDFLEDMERGESKSYQWVCREDVFWTRPDHGGYLYKKGEVISVEIPDHEEFRPWTYSGGWWVPDGLKVLDLQKDLMIPRQFEPLDFGVLKNKRDVNAARTKHPVKRAWKFKHELAKPVALEEMPDPVPLDPKELVTPSEPLEKFSPGELHARFREV
jgi:hypothetical protein